MLYDALVALHVAAAVVGFGAVAVSGAYGAIARSPAGEADARRFFARPLRAGGLILAVPFLGAAALAARPGGGRFGALWVDAGLAIWVVAAALFLRVVVPAQKRLRLAVAAADGRRLMWAGAACDFLFVVALLLMVTQPR